MPDVRLARPAFAHAYSRATRHEENYMKISTGILLLTLLGLSIAAGQALVEVLSYEVRR